MQRQGQNLKRKVLVKIHGSNKAQELTSKGHIVRPVSRLNVGGIQGESWELDCKARGIPQKFEAVRDEVLLKEKDISNRRDKRWKTYSSDGARWNVGKEFLELGSSSPGSAITDRE